MGRLQQQVSELQAKVHSKKVSSLPFWVGHVNRIQVNQRPMREVTLLGKAVF